MLPKIPLQTSHAKAMPRYSNRFGHVRNEPPRRVGQKGTTHPLDREDISLAVVAHFWAQLERRFWAHVVRLAPDKCWEWRGTKRTGGYGFLRVWILPGNPEIKANRLAWLLEHGSVPVDRLVCHRCDNPGCVNPAHLFLGTHRDNAQDMLAKGRKASTRGEHSGQAKLNDESVRAIKVFAEQGVSGVEIARRFKVSSSTVSMILRGRNWSHVA